MIRILNYGFEEKRYWEKERRRIGQERRGEERREERRARDEE